jgi:hypothetical protein
MIDLEDVATRLQTARQVSHWTMAASRLSDLEDLAAPSAWDGLERYLGVVLRQNLTEAVNRLQQESLILQNLWRSANTENELRQVRQKLLTFRWRYLQTETLLDFYADALNTRTNPNIAALLNACDVLAQRSMSPILDRLGKMTPPILTYIDKGLGASILKAGLRLWDGSTKSQVAAIKIVRHNLYRPTALIHEAGHQFAHIVGWTEELATALERLAISKEVAAIWASWASEIAADAFAFANTGYAAVAGLHDVLAGGDRFVFRFVPGDPHPISYIRVLLGTEMCRQFFGAGDWDDLAQDWTRSNCLENARPGVRRLLQKSLPLLPKVVELSLAKPLQAFGGQSLAALLDPQRVHPSALLQLEQQAGAALYTSHHWVRAEPVRLLGLTGYRAAIFPEQAREILQQQKDWMLRLGSSLQAV